MIGRPLSSENLVLSTPPGFGGACDVDDVPSRTYAVSAQFKTSSGA